MSNNLINKDSFAMVPGITHQELEDKFVVGTYQGTGDDQMQNISLGKKPLAVFIFCGDKVGSSSTNYAGLMFDGFPLKLDDTQCGEITDTGFTVTGSYNFSIYNIGLTYGYFAVL